MSRPLLLNCDLGESFGAWTMGDDSAIMPLIDCANIACGFHASDPLTMDKTVALAAAHGVQIGAHPAYPDLVGFGRRSMALSPDEITATVLYQIGALDGFCRRHQTAVRYVKPHGALYHDMIQHDATFRAILTAVQAYDPSLPLVLPARFDPEPWRDTAAEFGLQLWFEGFADRAYQADANLVPRHQVGAVLSDLDAMVAQALQLAAGSVSTQNGKSLALQIDTLCVHGDTPQALAAVRAIRAALAG